LLLQLCFGLPFARIQFTAIARVPGEGARAGGA